MEWHQLPWSAIVTGTLAVIGFIAWLIRLEMNAHGNAKDLRKHMERQDRSDNSRDAATAKIAETVGMTNTRIHVVEKDLIELRAKAVSREDLKDMKGELIDRMDELGDRMDKSIDRFIEGSKRPGGHSRSQSS